ncbi:hypothetical protein BT67DRAFT_193070 [Trichocladium antarcticum]|uniref:Uncharacterized protein n=1 Tax=Trichocladium antarcticum TaxID=1450529 RepID=A0AAN6UQ28_9PEZI|nr:hypothetical protein BT67DRAFT_193070 [Trichocladium antarcticum]
MFPAQEIMHMCNVPFFHVSHTGTLRNAGMITEVLLIALSLLTPRFPHASSWSRMIHFFQCATRAGEHAYRRHVSAVHPAYTDTTVAASLFGPLCKPHSVITGHPIPTDSRILRFSGTNQDDWEPWSLALTLAPDRRQSSPQARNSRSPKRHELLSSRARFFPKSSLPGILCRGCRSPHH